MVLKRDPCSVSLPRIQAVAHVTPLEGACGASCGGGQRFRTREVLSQGGGVLDKGFCQHSTTTLQHDPSNLTETTGPLIEIRWGGGGMVKVQG